MGWCKSGSWYAKLVYGVWGRLGFSGAGAGVFGAEAGDVVHAGAPTGPGRRLHLRRERLRGRGDAGSDAGVSRRHALSGSRSPPRPRGLRPRSSSAGQARYRRSASPSRVRSLGSPALYERGSLGASAPTKGEPEHVPFARGTPTALKSRTASWRIFRTRLQSARIPANSSGR